MGQNKDQKPDQRPDQKPNPQQQGPLQKGDTKQDRDRMGQQAASDRDQQDSGRDKDRMDQQPEDVSEDDRITQRNPKQTDDKQR